VLRSACGDSQLQVIEKSVIPLLIIFNNPASEGFDCKGRQFAAIQGQQRKQIERSIRVRRTADQKRQLCINWFGRSDREFAAPANHRTLRRTAFSFRHMILQDREE
jgi:hypothetical protein